MPIVSEHLIQLHITTFTGLLIPGTCYNSIYYTTRISTISGTQNKSGSYDKQAIIREIQLNTVWFTI